MKLGEEIHLKTVTATPKKADVMVKIILAISANSTVTAAIMALVMIAVILVYYTTKEKIKPLWKSGS